MKLRLLELYSRLIFLHPLNLLIQIHALTFQEKKYDFEELKLKHSDQLAALTQSLELEKTEREKLER